MGGAHTRRRGTATWGAACKHPLRPVLSACGQKGTRKGGAQRRGLEGAHQWGARGGMGRGVNRGVGRGYCLSSPTHPTRYTGDALFTRYFVYICHILL